MPNENKTINYGLNQWQGNEYPKRTDFNEDNTKIDAKLKELEEQNNNLAEDVNELFQSVSDGKTLVAGAITDKGVSTSPTDTFQTMADNIDSIETDPSIGTTDAVAGDILTPKKVVSQGNLLTGTMPNRGAVNQNLTAEGQEYTIPQGYHNGLGKVKAVITGLMASVIKAGTTVGGILGTFTSDATAAAADILSGKSAYVNGNKINGSMVDRGTVNQILTTQGQQYTIPLGKHSGSGKITANITNLVAENIKEGVNVGGVVGTVESLDSLTVANINLSNYDYSSGYSNTNYVIGTREHITFNVENARAIETSNALLFNLSSQDGVANGTITITSPVNFIISYGYQDGEVMEETVSNKVINVSSMLSIGGKVIILNPARATVTMDIDRSGKTGSKIFGIATFIS